MILESEAVVIAVCNNIQTVEMVDRKGIKNNNLSSEIRDLFNEEDEKLPADVEITSTNMFATLTRMAIYQKKERTIVTRQETIFQD